ncbi:hypothetical protein LUZ63_008892 [Rhynchospora breviuscula]|uniref:Uncharacterized protein n=1 Tax=Rhynchospora breviuscula TaxID=2022672 RepID=A0A9Q0CET9_9POAL|nr:hypothetical protein LUZ63_008892 [Rhynchospora breviuscula]
MADLLVSAVIPAVLKKVGNSLVQRIGEMWGIDDQRERLHNMLLEIQAVLLDAEDKGNANAAVKSWLRKLKSAAYDADDLLDEFCYEELRRDAVKHGQKVRNISHFFSLENPPLFRYKMSAKLKKVVGTIDGLVVQMRSFGFLQGHHVQPANRREKTDSLVFESEIVGRDEDKEKIVKLLIEGSRSADLTIVPLAGMGGLGKTTLAQLVYNDPRVKEHFNLPLWICVSEEFSINYLLKTIIDLTTQGDCNVPIDNRELLKRRVHQILGGKRYLLVLDDVWNENADEWERLKSLLHCGDSGSVVIVTTRSNRVASIMGTVESYSLGCLGEGDSWDLFCKKAFNRGVKKSQQVLEIGKKIVQNCGGLPLAINTLSSLMSDKHEVREWLAVYEESRIWETKSVDNNVLPVLRFSYEHLPLHMKQCFAFCAVFPKDYEMDKEKLIQYWMVNGFIPSDEPGSLEMKGNNVFKELVWRSFFQDVKHVCPNYKWYSREYGYCSATKCKMHDLMHDLAQCIVGDECLSTLELPTQLIQPKPTTRHISYKHIPLDINNTMNSFPSIRSFISNSEYGSTYSRNIGFLKSNSLRILELHLIPIGRTMVKPEKMKHLRYLEIRDVTIVSLPEAISTLYLLQTLRLVNCRKLVNLPKGMKYMSSLRHLYIEEELSSLRSMPSGLGQLKCLQTLTTYIVGTTAGNYVGELKNLNLHGTLHLYNIREVKDVANAMEANLIAKQNLDDLALCWGLPDNYKSRFFKTSESNELEVMHCNPYEVLDALKPCNNLKALQVAQYPGNEYPVWMTEYSMLGNLIELYIIDCRKCTKIPPVDKLPFLRILFLKFLNNLRHFCQSGSTSAKCGEDMHVAFPSLKSMVLVEMPNVSSWCEGEFGNETSLVLPVLNELRISNCPKLTAMPSAPLLEKLSVKGNRNLSSFAARLTTLQELSLVSCDRNSESANESLFFQPWESLNKLSLTGYNKIVPIGGNEGEKVSVTLTKCRSLELKSCNFTFSIDIASNSSLWFWKCFTYLERLIITDCNNLVYWPVEEFRSLNSLTFIKVIGCSNFLGLQVESPLECSITEALLPKLDFMFILHCPNLVEIPKCPTSLENLVIDGCKKLQCLPEWLGSMVALKDLAIFGCENLHFLPSNIGGLTSLEKIQISRCPNIRDFPEGLVQQLKKLDELWIERCPHLERHFKKCGKYQRLTSEIRITKIGGDPHLP